jgi:type VI secretion system protein ImpH
VRVAGASGRHGVPVNAPVIASETQIGRTLAAARPDSPLAQLVRQPFRFEFFQAVRLIALAAGRMETTSPHLQSELQVAAGRLPYEEHIRFRSHVGHAFPASAISSFVTSSAAAKTDGSVPEMVVTFLGLAGTGGVLPEHYTQMLIDRVREKDFGLRDFWDLFNHRLISYFYRGWEKCHFYVGYEQARRTGNEARDHFTRMLYSLVGLGTAGLQARHALPDEVLLYYAGHFSHRPRSAVALQQVVADCFHVRTEVQQFRGQWMILRRPDRTRLTAGLRSKGNNRLGVSAIAGGRVWGIENKFRLRLGPLNYAQFRKLMPGASMHVSLGQLVRFFVGPALDFDLQLVLAKREVPRCELKRNAGMQLGRNTWLFSAPPTGDVADAVFVCEAMPSR